MFKSMHLRGINLKKYKEIWLENTWHTFFPPFEKWVYYMYMIKEMNLEQQLLD